MVNGNTSGIRLSVLEEIEKLYEIQVSSEDFAPPGLLEPMAAFSCQLNREISVFLSRSGQVLDVSIGSSEQVSLPFIRRRRGSLGLSGVRCIHTHPSGTSQLSSVDVGTLLSSRLDAMVAVAVRDGEPKSLCAGFIGEALDAPVVFGPYKISKIPQKALCQEIRRATARVAEAIRLTNTEEQKEKAMLIGLNSSEESMRELALLADTAGAEVVSQDVQNRGRDHGYYIGAGKARELALKASALDADLAIFDDELTPIETKNLEELLGLKIVDRTSLILDIFARHATTREGKLQVELAQLKYSLPRLIGEGLALSRLGGGIGTRGPGESKLETDRRRVRRRIFELEQEIKRLGEQRELRRSVRRKNNVAEIALVGYTNAGKSSLLNAVSDAGVYAEDKLFATLDPVTRRVQLPGGKEVLFTDTVGFINKLPHDLINAFRSTLEEAARADLLLHVVDASHPEHAAQMQVVEEVLAGLGAGDTPVIQVFNKMDKLEETPKNSERAIYISARQKKGLQALLEGVEEALKPKRVRLTLELGYDQGAQLAMLRKHGENLQMEYAPESMRITGEFPEEYVSVFMSQVKREK